MNKFAKIYVVTKYNYTTGGVELTHQLVDYLRRKGAEAYIVYMKDNEVSTDQTVTDAYKCYDIKTTNQIEDDINNLLVLPVYYIA